MGRIKKVAGPKHEMTVSPAVENFVSRAIALPISQLPLHLETFPRQWPFPRGDLYHWIPLFNRFDNILEQFILEYGLQAGPQARPFGRVLLVRGIAEENKVGTVTPTSDDELNALNFQPDGDRELVEFVLVFTRVLLENCGNRSLYNSSDRLGDLLNTTDLSLLRNTLHLAVRLAQRYYASRQRGANASQSLNNALLASHYNIDLEKVQKLANPFTKSLPSLGENIEYILTSAPPPTAKGKDKPQAAQPTAVHPSDLLAMAKDEGSVTNGVAEQIGQSEWEDWGAVSLSYYQTQVVPKDDKKYGGAATSSAPSTPTPARRTSGLSKPSRLSTSDDTSETSSATPISKSDDSAPGGMKTVEISYTRILSTPVNEVVNSTISSIPKDYHYELLNKIRIARALSSSLSTRQEILGIRLLAITNLAYIYPEATFQQKILQPDSDEPRRLQLAYQLTDLIHPPGNRGVVPIQLQTLALETLEAFAKHKVKAPDVCAALNINVNHGVLFYALRKVVADLQTETRGRDEDEWRAALFSLLDALPGTTPRTGETLIAAGLLDLLLDILSLRTNKAERCYPSVLAFLNNTIYTIRDAFQTLANSKGLDTISELIAYEVKFALELARNGGAFPENFRTQVIDYQIPFFQQQSLRWLFKFVNHMMSHGNSNFDRLLRNLIDNSELLNALRIVIVNAKVFGSSVWSGAVNIMSSFIHNEPTSYNTIAEAGLSNGLLEAITSGPILDSAQQTSEADRRESLLHTPLATESRVQQSEKNLLAQGILPATDAIVTIPQAFGAICLNNPGMDMFLASDALDKFFEIFESPNHVKSMNVEGELARLLGSSFDELVRHHPRLRESVMISVITMVTRVEYLCKSRGLRKDLGAKLWLTGDNGELINSADLVPTNEPTGKGHPESTAVFVTEDDDVVMAEALASDEPSSIEGSKEPDRQETADNADGTGSPSIATYINVAMKFLAGFFENSTLCTAFIEMGGVESALDFATLPSLQYDFNNQAASQEIARVIHMLAEQKPHLVLPSLVKRTQSAANNLEVFSNHADGTPFFSQFTAADQNVSNATRGEIINGTALVKSLVHVHTLCNALYETFSQPIYNSRNSHTLFSQVNLADMYALLIKSLGQLHRACVWEEILLQKSIPEGWREATRTKGYIGSEEADELFGFLNRDESRDEALVEIGEPTTDVVSIESAAQSRTSISPAAAKKARKSSLSKDEASAQFKNVRTLRYLLSQIPSSIIPFFQGLGKSLIAKRRPEAYGRQNAYLVAVAMSEANLEQLRFEPPRNAPASKDRYAYLIVILTSISQLMIEGITNPHRRDYMAKNLTTGPLDRPQSQCLTLVLQAFKDGGGLDAIKELLRGFFEEVKCLSPSTESADGNDGPTRLASAYGGIKIILNFFTQIITSKSIAEASQTVALASYDRERGHMPFFSPPQFLVELRMAVLPVVRSIWDSEFVDKASGSIVKCLIEILRIVLDGSDEQGAFKRGDKLPARVKPSPKTYNLHNDKIATLKEKGYDAELAREALYRCVNVTSAADEYCRAQEKFARLSRNPIPAYDQERSKTPSAAPTPRRQDSDATIPDSDTHSDVAAVLASLQDEANANVEVEEEHEDGPSSAPPPPPAPGVPVETDGPDRDGTEGLGTSMSIDNLLNLNLILGTDPVANQSLETTKQPEIETIPQLVTISDLEDERTAIRSNLIDRALDVLNIHDDVTFELADLINAAAAKAGESVTMRREIGETLVQSLISFHMDDDFRSNGKKIAAYANLLALVLQDRDFYEATLEDLKTNFGPLLGFIKIFPEQTAEQSSPWIGQILLIIEKMLAEDVQPSQIQWPTPNLDGPQTDTPIVEIQAPLLPMEEKIQLFKAIVEILHRICKDESLALSVIRTLVTLTRYRPIADMLAEKRNLQRLFVMVKQLAGITNERVQTSFMILLRHIIEDDDTIRQIMRSEILANFEARPGRPTETTTYVRQMYHLVLRSPSIFIEVTNEKLEIAKYDKTQRPQVVSLKEQVKDTKVSSDSTAELDTEDNTKDQNKDEEKLSNLEDTSKITVLKPRSAEIKAPVVEHPSGVIHYLLYELLNYKDVEDKEHPLPAKDATEEGPSTVTNGSSSSSTIPSIPIEAHENKKADKPAFKADQHPIYIYRCFILQCLAELLRCYNRTKIEFINFSRKADPKAVTPSKPRSGVLNYLLNELVPVGTLNHDESISHRKKSSTSNWAMSTIVSLCLRTNEYGYEKKRGSIEEEDETDLLFVRKFVLEHALKAYKDANTSEEPLDVKYARLLCISDLFNRMLSGKFVQSSTNNPTELATGPQMALAKLMFEKGFISALTVSIADIDLNFPSSKRAVKYILRPLKQLTSTAIILSETIVANRGQTDDGEISTATSVTGEDDEREETPDLFRNSTLGMFEPGREEESSSESSEEDEEMYDDEYEEGDMDYAEGMERDEDDVISDEEEIEGVGHIEGMHGDTAMEDDEPSDDDDDQDDSDDMDEDDDVVEVIDEITGDSENDSGAEDWQNEDGAGRQYPEEDGLQHDPQDHESAVRELVRNFTEGAEIVQNDNEYMNTVIQDDDDDDAEDDEEEDGDVMYSPGYEDEEPDMPDQPWGWGQDDEDTPIPRHHHHHHHSRRIPSPWTIFPTASLGDQRPTFRSHRPSGGPRTADDGVNPLLQRSDRAPGSIGSLRSGRIGWPEAAASMSDYWVHGMESGPARSLITAESPVSFVNTILSAIGQGGSGFATMGGPHGALHFHVGAGARGLIPRELQAVLGLRQPLQEPSRVSRDDNLQPVAFLPASTVQRWQEEARILFGTAHLSKAERIINALMRILVPPAVDREHKKQLDEAVKEAARQKEKQRAETAAKELAEKEALEKKEQAEREAAAAAAAAEAAAPEVGEGEHEEAGETEAMEGIETANTEESSPSSEQNAEGPTSLEEPAGTTSEPTERVRTTIRGRELDITGMGVDLEYLDALPEDLREEVLMHQLALQRSQAAAAGEEPTDISREFLEALPPDIREELLQQEAQDRRRREREEERRRRGLANSSAARAEEMDPASFLASLDPTLRQAVLMEQDEDVLAHLPRDIAAEARALGGDRIMGRFGDLPRLNRGTRGTDRESRGPQQTAKKPQRKQIVQMLDRAGVATLLRLMFIPQQGSSRQLLNDILLDVSQNKSNRGEVVSVLLSILQDGSTDLNAVERSFASLSLRAKPMPIVQKTLPLRRALSDQINSTNSTEMTPLMVIQQCLSALVYLTQNNLPIRSFFLNEHDPTPKHKASQPAKEHDTTPRRKPSQTKSKGKEKETAETTEATETMETKGSKYALNALLSLLDRKLIMESSSCMEQLSSLLESVTHPLAMLLRKEKEKPEECKKITEVPSNTLEADTVEATSADDAIPGSEEIPSTINQDLPPDSANSAMPDAPADTVAEEVAGIEPVASGSSSDPEPKPEEAKDALEEQQVKKQHMLTPPVVPEENLRLVVNILAARECSAKTFRDTLSTINNLSAIPDAKKIFGRGLIEQAQDLAQSILGDIDELVPQIQEAESGADIQGMALTKFSPASSDQAKLLRILTALDYLFDPKRNGGKTKPAEDDQTSLGESSHLKEDLLTTLYENSTFGLLWTKLGDCLSVIRQGEGMLNVASILLPLIEALMVVCKNTTIMDAPLMKAVKEFAVASPPPESRMENLFFRFTEDHRKILNDLVRHNPKLMSGTFSLLVKNPKVLEFDNKRNYFTRRLHSRGTEARHPQPPLQLSVRRDQVFLDSFKFLSFKTGDEIKYGKLSIRFHGEEGVDAGGVTREWFQVLSRQMFNPDYALFIPVASDRTTFHPNKLSKVNEEHLMFFTFIGRIIGKALYEGRALDCHFSRAVYKRILGKTVSIKDMETLDLDYYKSLLWMLENDITEIITETFSVETDDFGVIRIVDLIENGRNIPVTEENKYQYVQLIVEYRLIGSVQTQLEQFLKGFHDVVPAELISIFNEQELELLISGLPDIDVDDWRNNTEYHNYSASSAQIQWFWRAVRSFDKEERAKLLQFVTGTSKVPLNGFSQLEGMNGFSRFNIHRDYGNKDRLPSSHTCFNQLDLPEYESYEILRQQVYTAMTAGSEYFGFA